MGYLVAAIGGIVVPLKDRLSAGDILVKAGRPWVVAEVIFIALTNVYSTALIASRISSMNKVHTSLNLHAPGGSNKLMHVLAIFIESAFIYSAWGLIFIATFAFKSTAGPIFANTYPTIAGIAFALISARVEAARPSNHVQSFTNPMSRIRFETVLDRESGLGVVDPMQNQNHENEAQERGQMDSREISYSDETRQKMGQVAL
ncbi:hypothetical protein MPER_08935 [Moniliophthora perniciosa FA553]|nr:hypothetical protein MPER_08935 [Moniliophthora perniciosa FA553]